jgi:ribosomal protein L40E
MAKKTVGYVQLEWTCPNCGAKNPGPQKTCGGCGAAQPQDVQFEQAAREELVTGETEVERARRGADVHCAFCGARNPAGTTTCTQCGADLREGTARASGRVIGAHRDKPVADVACPSCGTLNPANARQCSKCGASMAGVRTEPQKAAAAAGRGGCSPAILVAGGAILLLLIVLGIFLTRTSDISGSVADVTWTRSVVIEGLGPVTHSDWRDEIPSEGVILSCSQKHHHSEDEPAANATEVCGTPFTVDKGSGYGEVVQECQYEVYAEWCDYEVEEWRPVDEVTVSGSDSNPGWPALQLLADQREGEHRESYEIAFDGDGATYSYQTSDPAEFARFRPGSRWLLKVNQLDSVVSVEPAD